MKNIKKILLTIGKVLVGYIVVIILVLFSITLIKDIVIIVKYKGEYCRLCPTCDASGPCEDTIIIPYGLGELLK